MAECNEDHIGEWFKHFISNIGIQLDPSDESETQITCNNCKLLAYLPHKTKCNHLFCSKCLQLLLNNNGKCLIDNQVLRIQDIEVSTSLKNLILNVPVPCPYKANGCSKIVNVGTAWEHVNECAKTYATCFIDCPWKCGEKVEQNDLIKHFETDCYRQPKNTSPIVSNLVQSDIFKTLSLSLGDAPKPQSNKPRHDSIENKSITFIWQVQHYLKTKNSEMTGEIHHLDSELFSHRSLAYQFKIRVYLNGSGYGKGTHISLFIGVNRGLDKSASLVQPHRLTVKILNQNTASNEIQMAIKKSLQYDSSKSTFQENKDKTIFEFYGFRKFCEQSKAEHNDYLKNGVLVFEVIKELI